MKFNHEQVREALGNLDPANEEHWTQDGLPRLDAVEALLGGNASRKLITDAAPDFTREVAQAMRDEAGGVQPSPGAAEQADAASAALGEHLTGHDPDADPAEDEGPVDPEDDDALDPLAPGHAERQAEMDEEVRLAEEALVEAVQARDLANEAVDEAQSALDALKARKAKLFPPISPAEAIQQFQKAEFDRRMQAAQAAQARAEGASPLDAAFAATQKNRVRAAPPVIS